MDQQRMQVYVGLIEQLLGCPQGEEAALLEANGELVDAGLVAVMGQYADMLESQGNGNAGWLRQGAAQLAQVLGDGSPSSLTSGDAVRFGAEIVQLIGQTGGDRAQVYEFFRANVGRLDEVLLGALPDLFAMLIQQNEPELMAAVFFEFGNLIQQFPLGSRMLNLELGIASYEQALQVYTHDAFPEDWAMTQNNLANAYAGRIRGERAENLERAISFSEQALQFRTRDAFPEQWAMMQNNLANAYKDRIRGERAENLERAIEAYEQAFQVYTRDAFPEQWAMMQNNLANAYADRIRGERAENLERAIEAFEQALQVYTRDAFPEQWAMMQNNLANAYAERIRGKRAENIERAIKAFEQALQVRTRNTSPEQWAMTLNNLAIAYKDRIRGERAENLERAIEAYEQTLKVYTRNAFPEQWAGTQNNLALAYWSRIRGERAENLERAISFSEQALQVYTRDAFPEQWAMTQIILANAYKDRIREDRAENIEQAISSSEQALQVYTRNAFPERWAGTQNNLALAYKDRIRGERAENLERAISFSEQALQVYTLDTSPEQWALTQNNLALTYTERIRGERAENLERAISFSEQALQVYTRDAFPERWAMTLNNLAIAYKDRIRGERSDNLERAIEAYQQSLQVLTCDAFPERWAMTLNNLANAYADRIRGERAENLERAISSFEQALQVYTRDAFPEQWAGTQNNLALAYAERIQGERAGNLNQAFVQTSIKKAIEAFEQALQVYTRNAFPKDCRRTARSLGNLHFQEKSWTAAIDAYQIAAAAAKSLYQASISYDGKGDELKATGDIPRRLAYAQAQLGNFQPAVLTLEQGRARGLSESLNRDRADLTQLQQTHPDLYDQYREVALQLRNLESQQRDLSTSDQRHSITSTELRATAADLRAQLSQTLIQIRQVAGYADFLAPPSFEDVRAALSPECHLVYLVTTPNGSMALTVTIDAPDVLWLDDLTETKLIDLLNQTWFAAYSQSQTNPQGWYEAIDTTTRQLWDALMGPLAQKVKELGFDRITIIPTGYLSLLPLHAAWIEDPTQPTGRRYALDHIQLTYAPNAQSLTAAQAVADRVHPDTIFAIDNPSQDLPNSEQEVQAAIASFLPQVTILRHHCATTTAVKTALPQAAIAHFSCHGTANLTEPLNNGLLMSDGLLTLKDIFSLNLADTSKGNHGLRLAILSACETGMIGTENADEAISLPTGLLQAGVAAVIASLWSVSDLSTMLLLTRFYHLWRQDGLEPAAALRAAQQWVRDTTNGEKAAYFKTPLVAQSSVNTPGSTADYLYKQMLLSRPEQRDFAHPFHWAAFSYTGV